MKVFFSLLLLLTLIAHAEDDKFQKEFAVLDKYCVGGEGNFSTSKTSTTVNKSETIEKFKGLNCTNGFTPVFYYEQWKDKDFSKLSENDIKGLSPSPTQEWAANEIIENQLRKIALEYYSKNTGSRCTKLKHEGDKTFISCDGMDDMDISGPYDKMMAAREIDLIKKYYDDGKKAYEDDPENKRPQEKIELAQIKEVKLLPTKEATIEVATVPIPTPASAPAPVKVEPAQVAGPESEPVKSVEVKSKEPEVENVEVPVQDAPKDCKDELNQLILAFLSDEKKNILGKQYELTVLKVAQETQQSKQTTLEGLIKSKSQELKKLDDGTIAELKSVYARYGVSEDLEKVMKFVQDRSDKASYYDKHRRFFNESSSAFLMAHKYQNKKSSIDDADIAVVWLMGKAGERAKEQSGQFSAQHNLFNLSTRVATYTGGITPEKKLDEKDMEQKKVVLEKELESELNAIAQDFRKKNAACADKVLGADECEDKGKVQAFFAEMMGTLSKESDFPKKLKGLSGSFGQAKFRLIDLKK